MPIARLARLLCLSLALGTLFLALGCSSTGRTGAKRDLLIASEDAVAMGYRIGWATNLAVPRQNHIQSITHLGDRLIVIEEPNSLVRSVSATDGTIQWTTQIGDPLETLLGAYQIDDTIYVLTDEKVWNLRPATGEVEAGEVLDHKAIARAASIDNLIAVGAVNGRVFGFNPVLGFAQWEYGMVTAIAAPIVAAEPYVFAGDTAGAYAMIDARNGQLRWRGRTFGPIMASAAIDRLAAYIPSTDRSLYAVDVNSGEDRWIYRATHPLRRPPVVLGLTVYQPIDEVGLLAIGVSDGAEQWRHPDPLTALTSDDQTLLAYDASGLRRLSVADGSVVASAGTETLQEAIMLDDGTLLLVSPAGRLLALNPLNPTTPGAGVARAN
ncbi:MAG: PQQ-binding-like beta-propeller repeat protein [Planctomycetota bacterium]